MRPAFAAVALLVACAQPPPPPPAPPALPAAPSATAPARDRVISIVALVFGAVCVCALLAHVLFV